MLQRALEGGHLQAGCVAGGRRLSGCRRPSMSPSLPDGLTALGTRYVQDVPAGFAVWPPEPARTSTAHQGRGGGSPQSQAGGQQRRITAGRSDELPEEPWWEITVAEGSQGPRSHLFSAQRVRPTSRRKPGESTGPSTAGTWTAANPTTTCPMLRRIPRWMPWHRWEAPGGGWKRSSRR